jgi:hypothetical protein
MLPRSATGLHRLSIGVDAVVLADGRTVIHYPADGSHEVKALVVNAFVRTEAFVYQADDGVRVGRLGDDFAGVLADIACERDHPCSGLAREWLRTFSASRPLGALILESVHSSDSPTTTIEAAS